MALELVSDLNIGMRIRSTNNLTQPISITHDRTFPESPLNVCT